MTTEHMASEPAEPKTSPEFMLVAAPTSSRKYSAHAPSASDTDSTLVASSTCSRWCAEPHGSSAMPQRDNDWQ
jgi:hypothetical protein